MGVKVQKRIQLCKQATTLIRPRVLTLSPTNHRPGDEKDIKEPRGIVTHEEDNQKDKVKCRLLHKETGAARIIESDHIKNT